MKLSLPQLLDWHDAEKRLRFAERYFAAALRDDKVSATELSLRKESLAAARKLAHEKFACAMREIRDRCQGP